MYDNIIHEYKVLVLTAKGPVNNHMQHTPRHGSLLLAVAKSAIQVDNVTIALGTHAFLHMYLVFKH